MDSSLDAYSPRQIAERVDALCIAKARTPLLSLVMLGVLAGAFIGLGSLFSVIVLSDSSLGFAASRLLSGAVFSLGLFLVVVAGAELFTGNNLLAMAWADGCVSTRDLARNWALVCASNFVGAVGLAVLVFLSGHTGMNDGAIGRTYLQIAAAKSSLPLSDAFFRGIRNYYEAHKDANAGTEDLRAAFEKASGVNLRPFFTRWVYESGHPQYELKWYWLGRREVRIVLTQVQPGNVFTDPVPVTITTASGKRDIVLKPVGKLLIERVPLKQKPTNVEVDPHNVLLDEATVKGI